jgi:uncharacterized protein YegP (UPF0339 family)
MQPVRAKRAKFQVYKDNAGQWRWRLKAPNGRNIADSGEGYDTKDAVIQGIKDVISYAPNAEIEFLD